MGYATRQQVRLYSWAVNKGHLKTLKVLDVFGCRHSWGEVWFALRHGRVDVAKYLLKTGWKVDLIELEEALVLKDEELIYMIYNALPDKNKPEAHLKIQKTVAINPI